MLKIKPVFTVEDGKIFILHKVRGTKNAINDLVNIIITKYDNLEDKNITINIIYIIISTTLINFALPTPNVINALLVEIATCP